MSSIKDQLRSLSSRGPGFDFQSEGRLGGPRPARETFGHLQGGVRRPSPSAGYRAASGDPRPAQALPGRSRAPGLAQRRSGDLRAAQGQETLSQAQALADAFRLILGGSRCCVTRPAGRCASSRGSSHGEQLVRLRIHLDVKPKCRLSGSRVRRRPFYAPIATRSQRST